MMAYFDGLLDIHTMHDFKKCLQTARPLTSAIPYVIPWKSICIALPDSDMPNAQLLHVLNGTIVGLLSACNASLPLPSDHCLLRLSDIPLLPCVGLGKFVATSY
jgi:hypothetical protein